MYFRCGACTSRSDCGFCFLGDRYDILNSTCIPSNHSSYDEVIITACQDRAFGSPKVPLHLSIFLSIYLTSYPCGYFPGNPGSHGNPLQGGYHGRKISSFPFSGTPQCTQPSECLRKREELNHYISPKVENPHQLFLSFDFNFLPLDITFIRIYPTTTIQ